VRCWQRWARRKRGSGARGEGHGSGGRCDGRCERELDVELDEEAAVVERVAVQRHALALDHLESPF
jgi:hypothetical protein